MNVKPQILSLTAMICIFLLSLIPRTVSSYTACLRMFKKYCSVVRYGPNQIMFIDPASIHMILAIGNVFEKVSYLAQC
jgi:hypothetical protein